MLMRAPPGQEDLYAGKPFWKKNVKNVYGQMPIEEVRVKGKRLLSLKALALQDF